MQLATLTTSLWQLAEVVAARRGYSEMGCVLANGCGRPFAASWRMEDVWGRGRTSEHEARIRYDGKGGIRSWGERCADVQTKKSLLGARTMLFKRFLLPGRPSHLKTIMCYVLLHLRYRGDVFLSCGCPLDTPFRYPSPVSFSITRLHCNIKVSRAVLVAKKSSMWG